MISMKFKLLLTFFFFKVSFFAQLEDSILLREIYNFSLTKSTCHDNLRSLCKDVGHRLSGSPSAQKAVEWGYDLLSTMNLDSVYLQPVKVPKWVRGEVEEVKWKDRKGNIIETNCTALGGSIGTNGTIKGKVIRE